MKLAQSLNKRFDETANLTGATPLRGLSQMLACSVLSLKGERNNKKWPIVSYLSQLKRIYQRKNKKWWNN